MARWSLTTVLPWAIVRLIQRAGRSLLGAGGAWYHRTMVAFSLPGGLAIYAFSLLLALGAAFGLGWAMFQSPARAAPWLLNAGLWLLGGALVGGRAAYAAVQWPYYQLRPLEIFQVSLGGLAWPGALVGGFFGLALYALLARQPLGYLADQLLPVVASITVSAWLACWVEGCAYGPQLDAFWALPVRDEWGAVAPRWPLQAAGAIFTLAWFWFLDIQLGTDSRRGRKAALALLGLALQLFLFSFLRVDPLPSWRGVHLEAWAALGIAILSALFLFRSFWQDNQL